MSACECVCARFLETFGKREIQNLHWQTYKVRLFMVIVITLILVSFIYVLCQLEDWRHFSNSREIASKTRSTDLIFVDLRACVRACVCALFISPPLVFLGDVDVEIVYDFWCSTFFSGFKLLTKHAEFVSLVSKWFWMLLIAGIFGSKNWSRNILLAMMRPHHL